MLSLGSLSEVKEFTEKVILEIPKPVLKEMDTCANGTANSTARSRNRPYAIQEQTPKSCSSTEREATIRGFNDYQNNAQEDDQKDKQATSLVPSDVLLITLSDAGSTGRSRTEPCSDNSPILRKVLSNPQSDTLIEDQSPGKELAVVADTSSLEVLPAPQKLLYSGSRYQRNSQLPRNLLVSIDSIISMAGTLVDTSKGIFGAKRKSSTAITKAKRAKFPVETKHGFSPGCGASALHLVIEHDNVSESDSCPDVPDKSPRDLRASGPAKANEDSNLHKSPFLYNSKEVSEKLETYFNPLAPKNVEDIVLATKVWLTVALLTQPRVDYWI